MGGMLAPKYCAHLAMCALLEMHATEGRHCSTNLQCMDQQARAITTQLRPHIPLANATVGRELGTPLLCAPDQHTDFGDCPKPSPGRAAERTPTKSVDAKDRIWFLLGFSYIVCFSPSFW
jgi:hypothetical protein